MGGLGGIAPPNTGINTMNDPSILNWLIVLTVVMSFAIMISKM